MNGEALTKSTERVMETECPKKDSPARKVQNSFQCYMVTSSYSSRDVVPSVVVYLSLYMV